MPVHQRALDDLQGLAQLLQGRQGVLLDEVGLAGEQGVGQAFGHRLFAPGQVFRALASCCRRCAVAISVRRSVASGPAVQDHVLDRLQQLRLDLRVHRQLAGVDDAHVQPRGDGVVQEGRVHGLAHGVVAAEAEAQVADAAADQGAGHGLLDERQAR